MNRYALEHAQHIFPNQIWIKKNSPKEVLLVSHYLGNSAYLCVEIQNANISIPATLTSTQISDHYYLSCIVDNSQ